MQSERRRLGDFELVREIGRGGMGVVYEATQLSLNRPVALKVLPPGTTPGQRDIERFRREAQAAAQLDHPHIVPIYAQGEEGGTYYYAMKLVQGRPLNQLIEGTRGATEVRRADGRSTALSLKYFQKAAQLAMEAAQALEYAHSQGVIHRDIKPHNLILTPEGHVVITDFGLARFLSAPSITISQEMMGTPAYMSPEQVRAEQQGIDHRTDIYSLGVTLCEMLALEIPFRAETREAMLGQILMKDPPPLRRLNPRIPRDVETICHKAIEKDPNRRYQSAKLFAHDLHCFLEGLPISARPIGPVGRLYRQALRRKALTAAVVGVLVALVLGLYFGAKSYRAHQRELEERRGRLFAQAASFAKEHSFADALSKLKEAASIKHDHATLLSLRVLAGLYSDRPLRTLGGQTGVSSVAFSPDGKTLASGSDDRTVKLWDVATGRELRTLTGHVRNVFSVAFSPDGKTLASAHVDGVSLWEVASGGEVRTLLTGWVLTVAFSPDGKTLAAGSFDATIGLWDVASGTALRRLTGHTEDVNSVVFSPDGKTLASGSYDHTIRLWDVGMGTELLSPPVLPPGGKPSPVLVALSPDGGKLAYSSGKEIFIYDFRAYDKEVARWLKAAGVAVDLSSQ